MLKRILLIGFLVACSDFCWAQVKHIGDDPTGYTTLKPSDSVTKIGDFTLYDATDEPTYKKITCKISKVYDGDNVGCRTKIGRRTQYWNFRILGIDAPEVRGHQPYYAQSREILTDLVLGQEVTVELRGYDSIWRRHTVLVWLNGEDIGFKQVTEGAAWFYPMYARTLTDEQKQKYEDAQTNAKLNHLGLWADDKPPVSPSDWRRGKR